MKVYRDRSLSTEIVELCSGDVFLYRDGDYYIRCARDAKQDNIQCVNLETGCCIFLPIDVKVCPVEFVGREED